MSKVWKTLRGALPMWIVGMVVFAILHVAGMPSKWAWACGYTCMFGAAMILGANDSSKRKQGRQ